MKTNEGQQFGDARDEYACWIPISLIAAGTIGAVVGLARGRTGPRRRLTPVTHSEELTPPHGDKLLAHERR